MGHFVREDACPKYWPGDDIQANTLASEEYRQITASRMARLKAYLASEDFPSGCDIALNLGYKLNSMGRFLGVVRLNNLSMV